jgi:hypothetical protein
MQSTKEVSTGRAPEVTRDSSTPPKERAVSATSIAAARTSEHSGEGVFTVLFRLMRATVGRAKQPTPRSPLTSLSNCRGHILGAKTRCAVAFLFVWLSPRCHIGALPAARRKRPPDWGGAPAPTATAAPGGRHQCLWLSRERHAGAGAGEPAPRDAPRRIPGPGARGCRACRACAGTAARPAPRRSPGCAAGRRRPRRRPPRRRGGACPSRRRSRGRGV